MVWVSGKRDLYDVYVLVFRKSAISMLSMVWVSGKARSPCCLCFGFQAKRDLHVTYGLAFRQSAISMLPTGWFSGKRDFHDACDLVFRQARQAH
jgi:hypothetical protein